MIEPSKSASGVVSSDAACSINHIFTFFMFRRRNSRERRSDAGKSRNTMTYENEDARSSESSLPGQTEI